MKLLCVVLVSLVASASALPSKRASLWVPRIVGGSEAAEGSVPHQISLQYYGSHICGGSIYNEQYIITAGHCAEVDESGSAFSVVAGVNNIRVDSNLRQEVDVAEVIINPGYDSWTINNDIAILRLASPLNLGADLNAQGIALTTQKELPAGTDAVITGWGTLTEGSGSLPATLRTVTVPLVTDKECRDAYGESEVADSMICAGIPAGGKDSCQGDSGGPLTTEKDGVRTLTGIVSWGYGCARPNYPGVYTEVAHFVDFVESEVAKRS